MSIADKLREARALIEDPARWTRLASARDAHGQKVSSWSRAAVCWCAMGAVERVFGCGNDLAARRLLREALPEKRHSISRANDTLGHAAVLSMFDEAIRLAEAAE